MYLKILLFGLFTIAAARDTNVLMTEVFEIVVDPLMFNWTYEDLKDKYVYQASLLNSPDLPSWIHFVYSKRHRTGFLFGVPPKKNKAIVPLEIVALNKKDYETRIERLNIIVSEKLNPARYEVHMKIDNLNVEDMFNVERMEALKDIFRKQLWKDSENDLYVTLLNSAIEMGARKPLNPSEGEGIVIRLGSEAPFSTELIELQEEVRPLFKVPPPCPREYKRTSVERLFRDANFLLDWCSFRLLQMDNNNSAMHQSGTNGKESDEHDLYGDYWQAISRYDLPRRRYLRELLLSTLLPVFIMVVLALVLSFVLCFHHDELIKQMEDIPQEINKYSTLHKTTDSVRSFSNNRESLSPDPMLICRSHTNSPNSSISRGVHCRPSPPPYVRPKFKPDL